ncbi:MAG: type II toxin-antitoxin system Phd/YefM family antitoxin [Ruminococcus sp.]|nr:type II toxin-antitoxin system Phd/YefM family antitoxin [Ruminococcus sp.]
MTNTNATNFRKDLYNILKNTICFNEPVSISTKDGSAVLLSEDDYNGLMETLYLTSIPNMEKKLLDGKNTPVSECILADEVDW